MESMWLSLGLSLVCTNFTNPYILYSQRVGRKETISFRAASSHETHLLYFLGHLFGGMFFLLFAYQLFYVEMGSVFLWYLAICGAVFEWVQALLPARGKLAVYHSIFAWGMALSMSVMIIAAPLLHGLDASGMAAFIAAIAMLLSCAVVTLVVGIQRFWIPQVMFFFLFYVVMALLAL